MLQCSLRLKNSKLRLCSVTHHTDTLVGYSNTAVKSRLLYLLLDTTLVFGCKCSDVLGGHRRLRISLSYNVGSPKPKAAFSVLSDCRALNGTTQTWGCIPARELRSPPSVSLGVSVS